MFKNNLHTTFLSTFRVLFLLVVLNASAPAFASYPCMEVTADISEQLHNADIETQSLCFFGFCSMWQTEEETKTELEEFQDNSCDYIVLNHIHCINHALKLFSSLHINLPFYMQLACIDQPVTPPEQA